MDRGESCHSFFQKIRGKKSDGARVKSNKNSRNKENREKIRGSGRNISVRQEGFQRTN